MSLVVGDHDRTGVSRGSKPGAVWEQESYDIEAAVARLAAPTS